MSSLEFATKAQLLQIALYEACNLDLKYAAVRELQYRYIPEEIRADILYRLGIGTQIKQVAEENGLTDGQVIHMLRAFQQKHKKEWLIGYKRTLKACGRKVRY